MAASAAVARGVACSKRRTASCVLEVLGVLGSSSTSLHRAHEDVCATEGGAATKAHPMQVLQRRPGMDVLSAVVIHRCSASIAAQ